MNERNLAENALGKLALYFGCFGGIGHYLYDADGRSVYKPPSDLPWSDELMDGGLLNNGKIADVESGAVYWTAGGAQALWYAFYWWDRSGDKRGNSNSSFYVRGFGRPEEFAAFEYACAQFPTIVARQRHTLVLQRRAAPPALEESKP